MLNPESRQPDKFENLDRPASKRSHVMLDAGALAPDDHNARAQFIIDAIPVIEQGLWTRLTPASKEFLSSVGLIARQSPSRRYHRTSPFGDFQSLMAVLPQDAKLLGTRALLLLTEPAGLDAAGPLVNHLRLLSDWFRDRSPAPDNATINAYRKLVLALLEDRNLQQGTFEAGSLDQVLGRRFTLVQVDSQLVRYLGSADAVEQREARNFLHQTGGHNDLPFLDSEQFREERREVKAKAIRTAWRVRKYALNFERLSGETRRAAVGEESLLAKFGEDCFDDCRAVFGSSIERTPGRGYYLSEARMEQLFFRKFLRDGTYARDYAHYGKALEQLSEASFFFMRGAIVVYHPALEYRLPVGPSRPVQRNELFTLLVANNHFSGSYELAALIPVSILKHYLMPSLSSLVPTSDDPAPRDISVPGFNLASLVTACEKAGLPAIMLANISTVFGGNVAGYPRNSEPFYSWEIELDKSASSNAWRDVLERVHHAWYVRAGNPAISQGSGTQERIELLRPLGECCHKVAGVAKGLLDLLDLFMARYDAWKCDLSPIESLSPRMLVEAYRWHDKLQERNADLDAYPLLCLADRYDWSKSPEALLDTATLEMFVGDGKRLALPPRSRGTGAQELGAWMKYVMPRIADRLGQRDVIEKETTLLLLPRQYVQSSQTDVPLPKL